MTHLWGLHFAVPPWHHPGDAGGPVASALQPRALADKLLLLLLLALGASCKQEQALLSCLSRSCPGADRPTP